MFTRVLLVPTDGSVLCYPPFTRGEEASRELAAQWAHYFKGSYIASVAPLVVLDMYIRHFILITIS